MMGKTWFMRGEYRQAVTELETALKLAPRDYDAAYTLGLAYLKQNQIAPAKQMYAIMLRQLGAQAATAPYLRPRLPGDGFFC